MEKLLPFSVGAEAASKKEMLFKVVGFENRKTDHSTAHVAQRRMQMQMLCLLSFSSEGHCGRHTASRKPIEKPACGDCMLRPFLLEASKITPVATRPQTKVF